jgi:G3E family GTPase
MKNPIRKFLNFISRTANSRQVSASKFSTLPVKPRIPVLLVTGFLGAGKTTFINRLLAKNQDVKIGIIENEFGSQSIDSKLIANYNPETILELNNGCICCSIFNEFSISLQQLVRKHDQIEQLIIETTGIADPGPVIEPFFQDEDLIRLFDYCGSVCIVDSANFLDQELDFKQKKQVILSDLIVLNKVNQASTQQVHLIRRAVSDLNPTARMVETNHSRVDDCQFFNLHAQLHDDFKKKLMQPFFSEPDSPEFHSFTIRFGGSVNEERFRNWFAYIVSIHRRKIVRIKGLLYWEDNPLLGIVQSVGGAVYISEGAVVNPFEPIENVLVFIGKDFSKYQIEQEFKQFLFQEN